MTRYIGIPLTKEEEIEEKKIDKETEEEIASMLNEITEEEIASMFNEIKKLSCKFNRLENLVEQRDKND